MDVRELEAGGGYIERGGGEFPLITTTAVWFSKGSVQKITLTPCAVRGVKEAEEAQQKRFLGFAELHSWR